ncbi:conserved exported hypothetical protein [Tenacibaculum sp. 190524A05c]|uniref:hypothetical protein n=1 Tax=Tenacibaculum platacis TaxID=3137852 RepID=UPI0031FA60BA
MKKYFQLLYCLLLLSFYSCNDQTGELQDLETLSVKEGVLTFNTEKSFLETLEYLKTLNDNEIKIWLEDLEFQNSHFTIQSYYDALPTEEDLSLEEKLNTAKILFVPSPAFSAIINKDGVYKIGEEYHRITKDIEYISEDYEALIQSKSKSVSDGAVKIFKLKKHNSTSLQRTNLNGQTLCAKYPETSYTATGFYGGNYFNKYHPYPDDFVTCGGGNYSFHTQTWYVAYSNFFSVGTWIKGRKYKKKGLRKKWRDDKMTYAKINNEPEVTNVTKHTVYFNVPRELYTVAIQTFRISYEYNDESKGLRKVNMTLQSIP